MACAFRLLVRRRRRSRYLRQGESVRADWRASDESQSAVCTRSAPDGRNRRRSAHRGLARLACGIAVLMTVPSLLPTASLLLTLDLIGTFVFALSGAASGVKNKLDMFGVGVL